MLVSEYFSLHTAYNKEDMADSTILTEDEMDAMRYACGYVPHALLKISILLIAFYSLLSLIVLNMIKSKFSWHIYVVSSTEK